MGDISELRGLVVVGSFIGLCVLLIAYMPTEIYDSPEYRTVNEPEGIFESIDIYTYAETLSFMMNETDGGDLWYDSTFYQMDVDLGNHDINMIYKKASEIPKSVLLNHMHYEWWGLDANHHNLEWMDRHGVRRDEDYFLSIDVIAENEAPGANGTSTFKAVCAHTTYHVTFAYNFTKYDIFENAWNNKELGVFYGVNFDQVGTSYSAFDLITGVLFYSLPETNPYVNSVIAIPLWISFLYIAYILILRAIGAVFGGGA